MWIERQSSEISESGMLCGCGSNQGLSKMPFLYLRHEKSASRDHILLIYFHANSEDIGLSSKFAEKFHKDLFVIFVLIFINTFFKG